MIELISRILNNLIYRIEKRKIKQIANKYNFPNDVKLSSGFIDGPNIKIGNYTYINDGYRIVSGVISKVEIGKHCAIGRNVSIAARSHNLKRPTSDEGYPNHLQIEGDIIIGDYCWIGDKVFIKHNVKVGNSAVIGANSVVTKDVQDFEVVAGVPARHIKFNKEHYRYNGET